MKPLISSSQNEALPASDTLDLFPSVSWALRTKRDSCLHINGPPVPGDPRLGWATAELLVRWSWRCRQVHLVEVVAAPTPSLWVLQLMMICSEFCIASPPWSPAWLLFYVPSLWVLQLMIVFLSFLLLPRLVTCIAVSLCFYNFLEERVTGDGSECMSSSFRWGSFRGTQRSCNTVASVLLVTMHCFTNYQNVPSNLFTLLLTDFVCLSSGLCTAREAGWPRPNHDNI